MYELCRRNVRYVLLFIKMICAIIFLFSAAQIILKQIDSMNNKATYKDIREIAYARPQPVTENLSKDEAEYKKQAAALHIPDPTTLPSSEIEVGAENKEPLQTLETFIPLLDINEDTVGWLQIPGTNIDYPVVKAEDNDFYLNHDFKKNRNSGGAIFMDYRNRIDPLDQNTVLYGHHMKDGTMFKDLVKLLNPSFLKDHSTIYFNTLHEEAEWKIFAVYVTDTGFDYIRPEYDSDEEFKKFAETIKSKASLPGDWSLGKEKPILTLSTCSYEFSDARLVVQAILLD